MLTEKPSLLKSNLAFLFNFFKIGHPKNMILIDYSSIVHRKIHTAISQTKPKEVNGKLCTREFVDLAKHYIFQELIDVQQSYEREYGDLVICLDDATSDGYWRKDEYSGYKAARSSARKESNIPFSEVFEELDGVQECITSHTPWKVVKVPRAEADDIMLVLAEEASKVEKVLIYSPDKDMIQAQRGTSNVNQYSPLTKKWLTGQSKSSSMSDWIDEHCILGDVSDGVPKVVDNTVFSEAFLSHLKSYGELAEVTTPQQFVKSDRVVAAQAIQEFTTQKVNRKKEPTGVLDVFKQVRFGPSTLQKMIKQFGSVQKWLDSNSLYRSHYDRNFTLVMREGIPNYIEHGIHKAFHEATTDHHEVELKAYLTANKLTAILMAIPSTFKLDHELTASDFDW